VFQNAQIITENYFFGLDLGHVHWKRAPDSFSDTMTLPISD